MSNAINYAKIEKEVMIEILCNDLGDDNKRPLHYKLQKTYEMMIDPLFKQLTYDEKLKILHCNSGMLGDTITLSNGKMMSFFDKNSYSFQEAALTDEFGFYKLPSLLHLIGKVKIDRDIIVKFITSNTLNEENLSFFTVINDYSKEDKLYIIYKVYDASIELGLKCFPPINFYNKKQIWFQPNICISYEEGKNVYRKIYEKIITNEQDIVDKKNILKIRRFINSYININPEINKQDIIDIIVSNPMILWDDKFSNYLSLQYSLEEMTNIFNKSTIRNPFVLYQNYNNTIYYIDESTSKEMIKNDPAAEIYIDLLKYGQEKNGNVLIYNRA